MRQTPSIDSEVHHLERLPGFDLAHSPFQFLEMRCWRAPRTLGPTANMLVAGAACIQG
jgi:hypothetical protein